MILVLPPTASAISGNTSAVAGAPGSTLPPWFETIIASAPASTASSAHLVFSTPFTMNGQSTADLSLRICSGVFVPASGLLLRCGSPALSMTIPIAAGLPVLHSSIFLSISSCEKGFKMGMPIPPEFLLASTASTVTPSNSPSPKHSNTPSSLHASIHLRL